jgi:hypothetical protein
MNSTFRNFAAFLTAAITLAGMGSYLLHAAEPATSYAVLQASYPPAPPIDGVLALPKGLATFGGPLAATTLNLSNTPAPGMDAPAVKMLQQLSLHYSAPNGLATRGSITSRGPNPVRGILLLRGSAVPMPGMPLPSLVNGIPLTRAANQPQTFTALDGLPQIHLQTIGEAAPAK